MASQHLQAQAQDLGFGLRGKDKAIQQARELQAKIDEKVRKTGVADPSYEFLELIGKGAFGRVYKSKYLPTNKIVAVKIVDVDALDHAERVSKSGAFEQFITEIKILKTLKDVQARNINLIYDAFTFDQDTWIISEYCPGGSVATLVIPFVLLLLPLADRRR